MDISEGLSANTCFAQLRRDGAFTDVELLADRGSVLAHRVVLAAHSGFFKARLSPDWAGEQHSSTVQLQHLQCSTLLCIVEGIYTGELNIDHDNALAMFAAASEMVLSSVANAAAEVRCFDCWRTHARGDRHAIARKHKL